MSFGSTPAQLSSTSNIGESRMVGESPAQETMSDFLDTHAPKTCVDMGVYDIGAPY